MKSTVILIYRGIYCLALGLFFVGLLQRLPIGESLRRFEIPLYYAFIASVALAFLSGVAFTKIPEWLNWTSALFVSALFVWYTWFSLGAPFVLHELHTLDPAGAANEIRRYQVECEIATIIAIVWFLTLPATVHSTRRQTRGPFWRVT